MIVKRTYICPAIPHECMAQMSGSPQRTKQTGKQAPPEERLQMRIRTTSVHLACEIAAQIAQFRRLNKSPGSKSSVCQDEVMKMIIAHLNTNVGPVRRLRLSTLVYIARLTPFCLARPHCSVQAVMQGMKQVQAAPVFGVTRQAVGRWVKAFRKGGEEALKARKEPRQLKKPFCLWTQEAVGHLIKRRYGIVLSRSQVGGYLKAWGMTPRKPVRKAYEQDPKNVATWLQEYPAIRGRAKREKAALYWGDEMGMRSDHQAGTTYAPRGTTPKTTATGRRFKCTMISAVRRPSRNGRRRTATGSICSSCRATVLN